MSELATAPGWVVSDNVRSLVEEKLASPSWEQIDRLHDAMAKLPQQHCPVRHIFTPGLYTRVITMPAGAKVISRIHLLQHPFAILSGAVRVRDGDTDWVTLRAGHVGVTMPGTRRILDVIEETVWVTHHLNPMNETDPDKIGLAITYAEGKHADLGAASAHRHLP